MGRAMTGTGWLTCEDPLRMARFLQRSRKHRPSLRKSVLFAWLCLRHVKADPECPEDLDLGLFERVADNPKVLAEHPCFLQWTPEREVEKALAVPGVSPASLCPLVREVFGNPFRPVAVDPAWLGWEGGTARRMARAIYRGRAF